MNNLREHWRLLLAVVAGGGIGCTAAWSMVVTLPLAVALVFSGIVVVSMSLAGLCVGVLWEDEWRPVR